MQLHGNTVLITGGTSGLGLAFAEAFYNAGSVVIICGRREDRLAEIAAKYAGIIIKKCDVAVAAEREELYAWVKENHPATNVLINNAGIQLVTSMRQPVDLQRIYAETEINFIAPIHLSSLFVQHLATKHEPAIVNISSGLAFVPIAFMPVYCATKAALHSLTMSMRYQLKNTPVKVFEIIPPSVDTELGHDRRADKTQTHGGMPVSEFIVEAMEAIKNDLLEAPIAMAKNLQSKRETMFEAMNNRFE
jgi:uncharacterized oxidoreductase